MTFNTDGIFSLPDHELGKYTCTYK